MPLIADHRRNTVEAAGYRAGVVKFAESVIAKERAAHAHSGGIVHDSHGIDALLFLMEEVSLHTRELTIRPVGPGKDFRTLRAVVKSLDEGVIDVHGLHEREIKKGVAAVAAAFMAGHAFRPLAFCHLGEDKVCLIAEAFIR